MLNLRNLSIRAKLTTIAMVTTGVALLLAGTTLVAFEISSWRADLPHRMTSMAEIIGANSTAALTFEDARAAE
jgi:hypothetical protein